MTKTLFLIGYLTILICLPASSAAAQSATATLSGTVKDESGAVVPNAVVKLTDNAKAFERTANADGDGNFIFTQLAPSVYTVVVTQTGFAETRLSNVVLNVTIKTVCGFN